MVRQKSKARRNLLVLLALTALAVCTCLAFTQGAAYAEGGPVITRQPESVEVNYPDGASFHVEVEDPEQVASYQWQLTDGYNLFTLKGTSAKTDTLVIPATEQDTPQMAVSCIITDKAGNTVESEPATLNVLNKEVDKTVLYVVDQAVEPGETLDLSKTSLGSGTVAFDKDGVHITVTDLKLDNSVVLCDQQLAPGTGFFFIRRHSEVPEYHFLFVGDCSINNTYYDPEYHGAGVDLNAYFGSGDDENHPYRLITEGEHFTRQESERGGSPNKGKQRLRQYCDTL